MVRRNRQRWREFAVLILGRGRAGESIGIALSAEVNCVCSFC